MVRKFRGCMVRRQRQIIGMLGTWRSAMLRMQQNVAYVGPVSCSRAQTMSRMPGK